MKCPSEGCYESLKYKLHTMMMDTIENTKLQRELGSRSQSPDRLKPNFSLSVCTFCIRCFTLKNTRTQPLPQRAYSGILNMTQKGAGGNIHRHRCDAKDREGHSMEVTNPYGSAKHLTCTLCMI